MTKVDLVARHHAAEFLDRDAGLQFVVPDDVFDLATAEQPAGGVDLLGGDLMADHRAFGVHGGHAGERIEQADLDRLGIGGPRLRTEQRRQRNNRDKDIGQETHAHGCLPLFFGTQRRMTQALRR
jgi:hypothetical protein